MKKYLVGGFLALTVALGFSAQKASAQRFYPRCVYQNRYQSGVQFRLRTPIGHFGYRGGNRFVDPYRRGGFDRGFNRGFDRRGGFDRGFDRYQRAFPRYDYRDRRFDRGGFCPLPRRYYR